MKIIGITGSSGAGKSTICEILKQKYKVKIIDADAIAKRLSVKGSKYLAEIVESFGNEILDGKETLNRKKLAQIIYESSEARERLNNCTFKYIKKEIEKEIKASKVDVIIDAPLLFESGLNKWCDIVIGVISNKELQLERLIKRDNLEYHQALERLNAQKQNDFYERNCDMIIENNNHMSEIEEQIHAIAQKCNITEKLQ